MTVHSVDIAIVGGGLMGASTALLMANVLPDSRVALIEKQSFTITESNALQSFDGRSTALAPTTIQVMQRLGAWQAMASQATNIRAIQVSDQGHGGWVRLTEADNQQHNLGAVVDNQALGHALVNAVQDNERVQVIAPSQVTAIEQKRESVKLHLDGGSSLNAQLIIIADGANSSLGSQLGIGYRVKEYHQHALVANVAYESKHCGVAYERFTRQGPMALLPLGGDHSRTSALVWTWPSAQIDEAMGFSDDAFLRRLQREFGPRLGRFTAVSRRASYPLQLSVAQEQVRSRLVMMGNAAHFLHPVAGQGFNLALRDALRLAEVLQQAPAQSLGELQWLQSYEQRQRQDQQRTIELSDGFNRAFGSDHPVYQGMRNLAMLAVEHSSWVRSGFIRQMSGRASAQANPWRAIPNGA